MTQEKRATVLNELLKMKEKMDSLYARSVECVEKPESALPQQEANEPWQPQVDILENDHQWWALLDLPGVDEQDLKVELSGHELIISGIKRAPEPPAATMKRSRVERPCGEFHRILPLPAEIRQDRVEAEFRRGVLAVRIDKHSEPSASRKITIHST